MKCRLCDHCGALAAEVDAAESWYTHPLLPGRDYCSAKCKTAAALKERIVERVQRGEFAGLSARIRPTPGAHDDGATRPQD